MFKGKSKKKTDKKKKAHVRFSFDLPESDGLNVSAIFDSIEDAFGSVKSFEIYEDTNSF